MENGTQKPLRTPISKKVQAVETVFSIAEESNAGGSSHCWVERRGDDYILFGNELGPMSEPCADALSALSYPCAEFGMDYVAINSSLSADDFREACGQIILSNVAHLKVNGVEIEARDVDGILALYKPTP